MCTNDTKKPLDSSSPSSTSSNNKTNCADDTMKGKVPGKDDYFWDYTDEPHATRRRQMLAKYPQIKELYGHDPVLKYIVTAVVLVQIVQAYYAQFVNGWVFFVAAYSVGGTLNHTLMFALHECSHNSAFKNIYYNRLFSIFANLPIAFPTAITFKRYHMDHHKYQGEDGVEVGISTEWEARIFQGKFMKFIFCIFQIVFYDLRKRVINPKKKWGRWEFMNAACQVAFNTALWVMWSPWSLIYLLASTWLGSSLHPSAGHLLAEHTIFVQGAETYSYYGMMNWFNFNIGYHNEHHDFPNIPGSRLPKVKEIAPEFYNDLPHHDSYSKVLYDFIMDDNISLYSRIKRHRLDEKEKATVRAR